MANETGNLVNLLQLIPLYLLGPADSVLTPEKTRGFLCLFFCYAEIGGSRLWWHTLVGFAEGRQRQEDHEFEASLGYTFFSPSAPHPFLNTLLTHSPLRSSSSLHSSKHPRPNTRPGTTTTPHAHNTLACLTPLPHALSTASAHTTGTFMLFMPFMPFMPLHSLLLLLLLFSFSFASPCLSLLHQRTHGTHTHTHTHAHTQSTVCLLLAKHARTGILGQLPCAYSGQKVHQGGQRPDHTNALFGSACRPPCHNTTTPFASPLPLALAFASFGLPFVPFQHTPRLLTFVF